MTERNEHKEFKLEYGVDATTDIVRPVADLTRQYIDNSLAMAAVSQRLVTSLERALKLLTEVLQEERIKNQPLRHRIEVFLAEDIASRKKTVRSLADLELPDKNVASTHREDVT